MPKLAPFFAVPTDVLLGVTSAHPGKRGPTPKLQRQLERLSRLPQDPAADRPRDARRGAPPARLALRARTAFSLNC